MITTYNRPESLVRLLEQLNESAGDFASEYGASPWIVVDIRNDGGEDVDIPVLPNLICNYYKEKTNNGKQGYWRLIDKANKSIEGERFDYFIQAPDDVEAKKTFFREVARQWSIISDPRKICLNLLLDGSRVGRTNWTDFTPRIKSFGGARFFLTGWNDLCFVSGRRFFEELGYGIEPVPASRWRRNPTLSSGVGQQISRRLFEKGLNMYQIRESIVFHGDHPSRMNTDVRRETPLISYKLDEIHCGVASYPPRAGALEQAVKSIIDQVDFLHVYLNDYKTIPGFLKHEKIRVHLSGEHSGNLGDSG